MTANTIHVPMEASTWAVSRSWKRLDELCEGVFDCPHSTPLLTESGPLVARSQDIRSGVFAAKDAAHVSEETYLSRIERAVPDVGDLLYSREGTYFGIAAEVPPNTRVCLGQRMVLIKPRRDVVSSRFLKYWLNSPILQRHLHGFRDGTVAERLNMPTIRGLPVPDFPLPVQSAIAKLLGALDDKIELLHRMNETMEKMAKAIFNDWFIDFGPTRAKMEGKPPYLAPEIWSLFPDSLGDTDEPNGWNRYTLGQITVRITKGTTPTSKEISTAQSKETVSFVKVNCLSDTGEILSARLDRIPADVHQHILKRSILESGDVLFSIAGTIGRVAVVADTILPANTNQAVAILKPSIKDISSEFLSLLLRSKSIQQHLQSKVVQGVQANLSLGVLSGSPCILPPPEVRRKLFAPMEELLRLAAKTREENLALVKMRDLLLPKLMSGEIHLKDAEKAVEAVV